MADFKLRAITDAAMELTYQSRYYSMGGEVQIAAGASFKLGFTSPLNIMFMKFHFRTLADVVRAYMYEGIPYTGGQIVYGTNRNRQFPRAHLTEARAGVVATVSNPISFALFGNNAGGAYLSTDPIIFKKDTPYIIEFINDANSQSDIVSFMMSGAEIDIVP